MFFVQEHHKIFKTSNEWNKKSIETTKKMIINHSHKYLLTLNKFLMMYRKENEQMSLCITKNHIESFLKHLHNDHETYDFGITLNKMKNEIC
jgi:hypothetical protein